MKPVSLVELSVQFRLIWLDDTAVGVRPLGAAGVGVVASLVGAGDAPGALGDLIGHLLRGFEGLASEVGVANVRVANGFEEPPRRGVNVESLMGK